MHSVSVFITAFAAVVAIASTLAFVTVEWSGRPRRIVIAILMASIVTFLSGVAATVLTAARDTYALRRDG